MVSYIGGKSNIGKWIRNYIPNNIETYVEPFSGMYWVFFNIDLENYKNLKTVVYNDFNPLNVNVFNCVKNYIEFYNVIKDYPSQKSELFYSFQKELFDPNFKLNNVYNTDGELIHPDYHAASKYLYLLSQVWSGTNPEKAKFIDLKGKYKSKFDSFREKLLKPKWQAYFDKITNIENLDFEEVIKKYDGDKTYFYCDPPYYKTENYYANHDFGLDTHKRLADCLISTKGKFSLSYYDFPQLSEWFPKDTYTWKEKEFSKSAMAISGKSQTKAVELLIMNY